MAVLVFSSFYVTDYYLSASYRHQVSPAYQKVADWLEMHASAGDKIMSNTYFIDYYVSDCALLSLNFTGLPPEYPMFLEVKNEARYLVIFSTQVKPSYWQADLPYGYQYAFSPSMNHR